MSSPCLGRACLGLRNFQLNRALFGNFLKCLAAGERGGLAGQCLPAPDGHIDISRVNFQRPSLAAGSLPRDQDSTPATKRAANNIPLLSSLPSSVSRPN